MLNKNMYTFEEHLPLLITQTVTFRCRETGLQIHGTLHKGIIQGSEMITMLGNIRVVYQPNTVHCIPVLT